MLQIFIRPLQLMELNVLLKVNSYLAEGHIDVEADNEMPIT